MIADFLAAVAVDVGIGVWLAAVASLFVGAFVLFLVRPSLAVALVIPFFAFLPTLKTLVSLSLGPAKDIIVLAAVGAAAVVCYTDRRRPDGWVLAAVAAEIFLYAINLGGSHNLAWFHGLRLMSEPLLLLLVGMALRDAPQTLRFAVGSLVATSCVVAAYGILQQIVGGHALVDWGYSFAREVRTIDGYLRSFGTLDDPFAYAAFLLFALAALIFGTRAGPLTYACGVLVLTGLATALVRTTLIAASAPVALWLIGRRRYMSAVLLVTASIAVTVGVVTQQRQGLPIAEKEQPMAQAPGENTLPGFNALMTLNGRVPLWKNAVGNAGDWLFGRGVGEIGTAATRASYTLQPTDSVAAPRQAVDSGYLATVADVGLLGLAVLLALFGRIAYLARRSMPSRAAWLGLATLAVLLIDAISRSSFTGFPTAFVGLFLVGVALAAADVERRRSPAAAGA